MGQQAKIQQAMGRRVITAFAAPFVLFLGLAVGNIQTWRYPQLWLILTVVFAACLVQPTYKPVDKSAPAHDRGTASQIVWSVYFAMMFSIVEACYFRFPESFQWDFISSLGLGLMLLGFGLRSWAFLTLGRFFTWHITVYEDHHLVKAGPYRLVRHPGYTGAWILYTAIPLMLHAWYALFLAFVIQFLAYVRRIRYEELALRERLGQAYDDYSKMVKTLIPFVW